MRGNYPSTSPGIRIALVEGRFVFWEREVPFGLQGLTDYAEGQSSRIALAGKHAGQAGSLVEPERLRFDFTHLGPIDAETLRAIERDVNEQIWANHETSTRQMPYRDAIDLGAMAFFSKKYGDVVRVVQMGDSYSSGVRTAVVDMGLRLACGQPTHGRQQILDRERLPQVRVGHAVDARTEVGGPGDECNGNRRRPLAQLLDEVAPGLVADTEVEEHDAEVPRLDRCPGLCE